MSGGHVFVWVSAARGLIGWPFISLEVFDWHGGRCLLCGVCRFCIFVPLFVGLPRGVVVLVNHSFRRSNLIGSWGQCLFCGVTHWDPIMWIFFCIYLSWCCATWGCYLG